MGQIEWTTYEKPFIMPRGVDFATFSNEDIGFIADLDSGTNDNYQFAMPYPSSIDLFEETTVLFKIDHCYVANIIDDIDNAQGMQGLHIYTSMLDIDFGAAWAGVLVDAEDEAWKSKFAGPMYCGETDNQMSGSTTALLQPQVSQPKVKCCMQYMPFDEGLDLITPLYETLTCAQVTFTEATGVQAYGNFTGWEKFSDRIWHRKRNLTSAEKSFRNISLRFQLIDT